MDFDPKTALQVQDTTSGSYQRASTGTWHSAMVRKVGLSKELELASATARLCTASLVCTDLPVEQICILEGNFLCHINLRISCADGVCRNHSN